MRLPKLKLSILVVVITASVLFATIATALLFEHIQSKPSPQPLRGDLDLRGRNFWLDGPVSLGGTWEFLPEKLVPAQVYESQIGIHPTWRQVPDTRFQAHGGFFAGTGSGTYRLRVKLAPNVPPLALKYSTVWTACEIEVNGTVVARVGQPNMDAALEIPAVGAGVIPIGQKAENLEIVVRVSNHHLRWGGIVEPFLLGETTVLETQKKISDLIEFAVMGALIGISFFGFFQFLYRRRDFVYLSFSVFALMVALKAFTSGDVLLSILFPNIGFEIFVRLDYLSQYLLIPAAALFFYHLFAQDISRGEMAWFIVPSLGFGLLAPFAPLIVLSWSLLPFSLLAVGLLIYAFGVACLRAVFRHRPGAFIVLILGTVLLGIIVVNLRNEVIFARAESAFPTGMIAFVLAQILVMAKRTSWAFQQTEFLSSQLKEANVSLQAEARSVEEARDRLEVALGEKDILLREVHHRVKNSLQIVLSIINLQARRTSEPGILNAYTSISDRIRAISLVHDRLFDIESEKNIALLEYIQDLLAQLGKSFGERPPLLQCEEPAIKVPMNLCLEIGLILTELVINAYQHTTNSQSPGNISVTISQSQGGLSIAVADDGPGFPAGFNPAQVDTVGFRIIQSIVTSRRGRLSLNQGPGAIATVWLLQE